MKRIKIFASVALALILSGCAQVGIFTANIPSHFSEVVRKSDILFDKQHALKLDIYIPKNARKADVVVFFYGGRWTDGSKDQYQFVGTALAEQGFVVVIPDYRKYPDVKFPAFIEDGARAVAWVSDHIQDYDGNPDRINLSGHSSGAHIAALITANPKYLAANGKVRDAVVKSFAGIAGPYDFTPEEKDLIDMFGPPENYPLMRPVTYANGKMPPLLLLHGADDEIVGKFNYEHLRDKVLKDGGSVKTKLYKGIDHVWIVGALSWLGRDKAPVLADMSQFFKEAASKH